MSVVEFITYNVTFIYVGGITFITLCMFVGIPLFSFISNRAKKSVKVKLFEAKLHDDLNGGNERQAYLLEEIEDELRRDAKYIELKKKSIEYRRRAVREGYDNWVPLKDRPRKV